MIFDFEQILPAAMQDANPFHQEFIGYILNLPGKRRPTFVHAKRTWNLNKDQFNYELQSAFSSLRDSLRRRGVHKLADPDRLIWNESLAKRNTSSTLVAVIGIDTSISYAILSSTIK